VRMSRFVVLIALFACALARPAAADLTVITHYTLVDGDTVTRANYYTRSRVRVTSPDGKEFMFNNSGDSVTVIDHKTMSYWAGPRSLADSVASKIMSQNAVDVSAMDPAEYGNKIEEFNKSIKVSATGKRKKIAGYPCDLYTLDAGKFLHSDRWIARSLDVPNYGPEMQKAVLATIKDPLGRQLMRMLLDMRTKDGLVLSGFTNFQTLSRSGKFSFDAVKVITKPIPKDVWTVPAGYKQVTL
jgi:uncharacterized protein DUF4412